MCPLDGKVFDSALNGAVDFDDQDGAWRGRLRSFARSLLSVVLFLPRLLFALVSRPFRRSREGN